MNSNFDTEKYFINNKHLLTNEFSTTLAMEKIGLIKTPIKDIGNKETKTYSEISTYATCKFKWNLEYKKLVTKKVTKHYFFFGSALHDVMEYIYTLKFYKKEIVIDDVKNFFTFLTSLQIEKVKIDYPEKKVEIDEFEFETSKGYAIIELYINKIIQEDSFNVARKFDCDEPFLETIFFNPVETPQGNKSNKYIHTGKVDGLVIIDGKYFLLEHKFLKSFNATDEEWLTKDWQILSYIYAIQYAYGIMIHGVIYNVVKKPALRMKKATKNKAEETVEEFRQRIIEDFYERPEFYFKRYTVWINQENVANVPMFIYDNCKDMANSKCLPASSFICKRTGCSYKDICLSDNPEEVLKENYKIKMQKHEEL